MAANPLKAFMDIRRRELPLALLMFSYFFLVITSFWILKPIKKSLFIQFYDKTGFDLFGWHMMASQAELLAKVLNMFVALAAVVVFTWLSRRYRRQQLTTIFSVFFMVMYALYSTVIEHPDGVTIWTFYLFGDLFSTLMVATFFVFMNDSVTPEMAKRMYGLVGLGGVLGGVFGTSFVRVLIESVGVQAWLWICFALAGLIILVGVTAGRQAKKLEQSRPPLPVDPEPTAEQDSSAAMKQGGGNPALEGARLVFRSPYLLSIVSIVGLYEIISTIMDFQFTATVAHYLDGPAIGRHFSTVFTITNWVSMLVQFFLTSFIMTRFGLGVALSVLPLAILAGSAGFAIMPALWVGSMLNTADNGFSYSINQSAKEALYVPTSRREKYRAKAFIDMFVQRFAKVLAVGISLLITSLFADFSSLRWLSLVVLALVVLWLLVVRFAGRRFRELTEHVR